MQTIFFTNLAQEIAFRINLTMLPWSFSDELSESLLDRFHQILILDIAFTILLCTQPHKILDLLFHRRIRLAEMVRQYFEKNAEMFTTAELIAC